MGKPKVRNGFFFYMIHIQQKLKQEGKDLGINSPKLQELAGNEWKGMNAEEREPFNRKAKSEKEKPKPKTTERQETFNRLVAFHNHEDQEVDRETYLDQLIESCVNAYPSRDELMNAPFFVVSSNVMLKTESNEWIPLEIGICQYTLNECINFTYHQFIDAGKVPTGYMHRAKSWSEDSHKIPIDNFYLASNNYQKIVEDIAQILDGSRFTNKETEQRSPMMVYCHESQIDQNTGVFKWLAKMYQKVMPTFNWDLEVFDLCSLLYHMSNFVGRPIHTAIANDYIMTSTFDYSLDTNCDFHESIDNKNCARGGARRYCYMISEALCAVFDIKLTDKHLPPKRGSVVTESYEMTLSEIRPQPINRYVPYRNDDRWAPTESDKGLTTNRSLSIGIGRGRTPGWGCSNR